MAGYSCPCGETFASQQRMKAHRDHVVKLPTKAARAEHGEGPGQLMTPWGPVALIALEEET